MTDPMAEIREGFFSECEDLLESLQDGLQDLAAGDPDAPDAETVNVTFRAVHSIKGGAGAFGLDALVTFAHRFETVLDRLRSGDLRPDAALMRLLFRSADLLQDHVAAAKDDAPPPPASEVCLADLDGFAGAEETEDIVPFQPLVLSVDLPDLTEADPWTIQFRPHPDLYASGNEPLFVLRALAALGAAQTTVQREGTPLLEDFSAATSSLLWTITLPGTVSEADIRDAFDFVDGLCDISVAKTPPPLPEPAAIPESPSADKPRPSSAQHGEGSASVRVNLDRIDRLVNLVGELVITQAMLAQSVAKAGLQPNSAVVTGLDAFTLLTREIQDCVMMIRAQPVKPLFQRMARIVREAATATGKTVDLRTSGETTEVDKTVIERLADPLTHMIRNAVDHGIESSDRRAAQGKAGQGVITLSARHRSGRLMIEVADDGGGIDRARVFETAVARGLVSPEAQLTETETDNLLFLPGFSTAKEVSALSGRGVGMDVVKSAIHALGGRITIQSTPNEGTKFIISLPLTLAILDGMTVNVAGETLVVPLSSILETATMRSDDVRDIAGSTPVMQLRGGFVPIYDLGAELGFRPPHRLDTTGIVLLTALEGGNRAALIVDSIVEQRQVVIKGLQEGYGRIPGIAAATILGDGRIALILDPADLVQNATAKRPKMPLSAMAG